MKYMTYRRRKLAICIVLLVAVILTGCSEAFATGKPATLDDLNDPSVTIGGIIGSVHEPFIAQVFPRAREKQFNTFSEMITALENGEIDAFVHAKDNIVSAMEENPGRLRMIDEPVGEAMAGMAISPRTKYPELKSQLNAFLMEMKESGELDKMHQRWMVDMHTEMPDIPVPEDPVGILIVGTSGELVPNSYYQDGKLVGHDIELTLRFANKYNYTVEFRPESIDEMLNDAESGQVDMLSGGIGETPERAKRVIFPDTPLYGNTINAVVLADDPAE
ncbi:MAG: transporter substrate-binding domain-containing protein [Clostridia bacterium]|nr:transporter substrate-binding domain-containing protein [Clostridia bacterium]